MLKWDSDFFTLTPIFADRLTTIIEYYLNPNIL